MDVVDPTWNARNTDMAEPKRTRPRTDKTEPRQTGCNADTSLLNRAIRRSENVEPMAINRNADTDEPTVTDERIDNEEPRHKTSRMLLALLETPTRMLAKKETPLPTRIEPRRDTTEPA
jgi:hypothetical protein